MGETCHSPEEARLWFEKHPKGSVLCISMEWGTWVRAYSLQEAIHFFDGRVIGKKVQG